MQLFERVLANDGFTMVSGVLTAEQVRTVIDSLGALSGAGRRNVLRIPAINCLATSGQLLRILRPHFTAEPFPVRGIFFDKVPEANWSVSWHQDLAVAVAGHIETPGFGPWSMKEGVPHACAPTALLERMITLRLSLDDASETNGALRVIPGSHRFGQLSAELEAKLRAERDEVICSMKAGDALLMRPLLLHSSSRTTASSHRRVLHFEYADCQLPNGLRWQSWE